MATEPDRLATARNPSKRELDLRASLENLPLPAYICDSEGLITYFNRQAKLLWGREPKLNDPVDLFCGSFKLFSPSGTPITHDQCWMALTLRTGKEFNGHAIVIERPDGRRVIALSHTNPIRDESGQLVGATNVLVDITDRKKTQETLARDALVMRSIRDSVMLTDLKGKVTYWNDAVTRLFGWTPEEMLGRHYADRFPEPMRTWVGDQIRLRAEGQEWVGEIEDLRKDGTRAWIDARVSRIADSSGRCIGILGLAQDISDRKRAEGYHAHLAAIVESSLDAIVSKNLDGTITSWNAGAEKIFGYTAAEIVGSPIKTIIPADRYDEEEGIVRSVSRGENVEHFKTIRVRKDGSLVNVSVSVSPILDAVGGVVGASKIARDITKNKEAEEKLRRSEHRLAEAQRVAHIGSWELDLRNNELTWSDETFRLFGFKPRESGITPDEALAHLVPEDAVRVKQVMDQALADRRLFICDFRVRLPDGRIRHMHGRGEFVLDNDRQPVRMVGTAQDITEGKQIEADREKIHQQVLANRTQLQILSRGLIQAQEAERRRLAGELHDEIGQVLTAVSLSLELAKATADEAGRGHLEGSMAIVGRAIDQIRNMSLNLRPAMLDVMGLESALRWFVDQQMNANGTKIELVSSLAGKRVAPELETACFRIVQETLTNVARHAQAHNVRVELTLSGTELVLSIQDDGTGFDVAAARLRATTGGSFGLLGMEERVRLLGGSFEIDSAIGCGTMVRARI